ncbi:MAG: hypothetical protein HYY68_06840 [Thaumarchaeota archaeon]|nr:hypothetical protein [Nitrososphaerota archaeon]
MTEPSKSEDERGISPDGILRISDELVHEVDRSKRLVLIIIAAIVVAVPVSWHLSPILLGSPYRGLAGFGTIVIAIAFLAIGVRQWLVLSKWTGRYRAYKELQRKIDEKLDFEGSNDTEGKTG